MTSSGRSEMRLVTPSRFTRSIRYDAQYSVAGPEIIQKSREAFLRGDFEEVERFGLELDVIELNQECIPFRVR